MKHSIRIKLTLLLTFLTSSIILVSWIVNRTVGVEYYMRSEEKSLIKTYHQLEQLYLNTSNYTIDSNGTLKNEREQEMDILMSNTHFNVLILNENFEREYPKGERSNKMDKSMLLYLNTLIKARPGDGGSIDKFFEQGYLIQKNTVKDLGGEYLDLFGRIVDRQNESHLLILRSPIQTVQGAADISNRLFAYIGITMSVIGAIVMFWASKKYTVPIQEMAMIANRMVHLDFDARVTKINQDEIGNLGRSMNELSAKLEETISELKTANNELQKDIDKKTQIDEMRKEFISHVSHELKTPIALIQGYAEGLKDNVNDDPESREFYCDVIMDEAHKMNVMVKKLLTLNQIEFGNNVVHMERFDIVALIRNLIQASDILYKKVGATVRFEQEEPIYVWADEYMIEEVMSNYLSNALHHLSEKGTITVRFETRGSEVRVFVANTGKQIPEEELDKLWIKFYKVDKARTREYGGSGVGLSIVAATMNAHGKKYGVHNLPDGVEFYIDLDINLTEKAQTESLSQNDKKDTIEDDE